MSLQDHSSVQVALDCHPACDQLTREYLSFLECSQGVTRGTLRKRKHTVGAFIQRALKHQVAPELLARLQPVTIHDYIIANASGPRWARKEIVSGLRSFLKFLHIHSYLPKPLTNAVPIIHLPNEERVPRGVPWPEIERLLTAPDRSTESGRRGYAILLLLATYGVRIGQALQLKISEVHWASGTIRFAAQKGGKALHLPLTSEVADALLTYLNDRGPADFPELFLSLTKPAMRSRAISKKPKCAQRVRTPFDIPLPRGLCSMARRSRPLPICWGTAVSTPPSSIRGFMWSSCDR